MRLLPLFIAIFGFLSSGVVHALNVHVSFSDKDHWRVLKNDNLVSSIPTRTARESPFVGPPNKHPQSCSGRVAVVTGASRGLGREIALALASLSTGVPVSHVVCVSRTLNGSQSTADIINAQFNQTDSSCHFPRATAWEADVGNVTDAELMVQAVVDTFGKIDILVNNAGVTRDGLLMRMSDEDWLEVINTNLNSIFYMTKPVLPSMIQQKWGRIINIASVSGINGNAGQTNYAASKAGVIGFTKSLAREVGLWNVRVNAVAPGFIESAMTQKLPPAVRSASIKKIPVGRFGKAHEVAEMVKFLASEASNYISGAVLTIDGGLSF